MIIEVTRKHIVRNAMQLTNESINTMIEWLNNMDMVSCIDVSKDDNIGVYINQYNFFDSDITCTENDYIVLENIDGNMMLHIYSEGEFNELFDRRNKNEK